MKVLIITLWFWGFHNSFGDHYHGPFISQTDCEKDRLPYKKEDNDYEQRNKNYTHISVWPHPFPKCETHRALVEYNPAYQEFTPK